MNSGPNESDERVGLRWAIGISAVALCGALVGFVLLPSGEPNSGGNFWLALCSAVGIPVGNAASQVKPAKSVPSGVVWSPSTQRQIRAGDAHRGKALSTACAGCHGAHGISASDTFPNLAGQPASMLFKQLNDFHAGKRSSVIMQGMAAALTTAQMADLAAYFSSQAPPAAPVSRPPAVVAVGEPLHGVAPCSACHGGMGYKRGAPLLRGQKSAYIAAQLAQFAAGKRHNDINQQMREIARSLSAGEIAAIAKWYGAAAEPR